MIEEEYTRGFNGKDFVRFYEYIEMENSFDPLSHILPVKTRSINLEEHIAGLHRFPHVKRVDAKEIFRLDLQRTFQL